MTWLAKLWPWPTLAALAVVLLIIVAVLVARWRARKAAAATPEPPVVHRWTLLLLWWRFLRALPARWRDAVTGYPVLVVVGPGGPAQEQLINQLLSAPARSERRLPDLIDDRLRIYPGIGFLLFELMPAILTDDRPATESALELLGRLALAGREVVVLAIQDNPPPPAANAELAAIKAQSTQQAKRAQQFRKRLEALTERCPGPVPVRLAMTGMDQSAGFAVLCGLLGPRRAHERLALSGLQQPDAPSLLAPYEAMLDAALAKLPAVEFQQLVDFLDRSSAALDRLREPVAVLTARGAPGAELKAEYLVLCGGAPAEQVGAPFQMPPPGPPHLVPLRWHLLLAGSLLVACAGPLLWAHEQHMSRVAYAERTVAALEGQVPINDKPPDAFKTAAAEPADALHRLLDDDRSAWPLWRLTAKAQTSALRERYADSVRKTFMLRPLRDRGVNGDGGRAMHWLALLYAAPDGQDRPGPTPRGKLHALLWQERTVVANAVDMPDWLVKNYLELVQRPWQGETAVLRVDHTEPWNTFWLDYLDRLERAVASSALTLQEVNQLRDEAMTHLAKVQEVQDVRLAPQLFLLLKELAQQAAVTETQSALGQLQSALYHAKVVDVRQMAGEYGERLDQIRWLASYSTPLRGLLQPISSLRLPIDAQPNKRSLVQLLGDLGHLMNPPEGGAVPAGRQVSDSLVYKISVPLGTDSVLVPAFATDENRPKTPMPERVYRFDLSAVSSSWAATLIKAFKQGKDLPPLLGADDDMVAAPFTRERLLAVRQAVLDYQAQKSKSGLQAREATALQEYVESEAGEYAELYRDKLRERLSLTVKSWRAETAASLPVALRLYGGPHSPVIERLAAIAQDGAVAEIPGGWDGPALKLIADELKEFEVLKKLTAAQDGKVPGMEPYVAWLQQLAAELSGVGPAVAPESLAGHLPPIGRVALAERLGADGSYGRRLDAFLAAAAVPEGAWVHFRAPLEQVRSLGDREIEAAVAQQWGRVSRQLVTPVLVQYPFARSARDAARAEELEALRRPSGAFWQFFTTYAAPLAEERAGVWQPLSSDQDKSLLPPGLLDLANRLGRLSQLLWDEKGQPQALPLKVTPRQLPNIAGARVSVLRCGASEVKGFNQRPTEQPLRVSWWAQETAAVGLALAGTPAEPQDLRQARTEESPWSCLRLLDLGKPASDKATTWDVGLGNQGVVGFTVTGDALKIIQDTANGPGAAGAVR